MSVLTAAYTAYYAHDFEEASQLILDSPAALDAPEGHALLAWCMYHQNRFSEIVEAPRGSGDHELLAIRLLAQGRLGFNAYLEELENLLSAHSDNNGVRFVCGYAFAECGEIARAKQILSAHKQSSECLLLLVYLLLTGNEKEHAAAVVAQSKSWANDHITINLAEALIALSEGGEKAQKAFYIFEEANDATKPHSFYLVGEAVAQLQQGRVEEAAAALQRAHNAEGSIVSDVKFAELTINAIKGTTTDATDSDAENDFSHPLTLDLHKLSSTFDEIVAKYSV